MANSGWSQLRQQARNLESQTESVFHTYSQFGSTSTVTNEPSGDEKRTESQINDLLERREALVSQLARLLDSDTALTASALKQNNLGRHREILTEHRRELQRIKSSIQDSRNRANLLSNVRNDISTYRAQSAEEEAEYMLDERSRLDRTHNVVDGVLSQAYAINENFGLQRETLANINRRVTQATSMIPGLNSLMGRIGAKRRRDGIILGSFIAVCFLFFFFLS